jgi:hypothetical protein
MACSAQAGSAFYDFNAAPPADLNFVGNAIWRGGPFPNNTIGPNSDALDEGGVGGTGYISLVDSINSELAAVLIPDFDAGLVVKSFTFEVDLRIGNATGNSGRPADGFSISYANADDPVVVDLAQEPPVVNWNNYWLGGAPENGTKTGLSISFDTWAGNALPDGSADMEGIMIMVNGTRLPINAPTGGIPLPTRNGACDDATSLQTGLWNVNGLQDGSTEGLCWAHLKVEVDESALVTVTWKNTVIVDHVATGYSPSAGRIVFAGRTGGANENTHIDNLRITTVPASTAVISNPTGTPTGFTIQVSDSGPSVFDATAPGSIVAFMHNGTNITASGSSKSGTVTTLVFRAPTDPIPAGSANTTSLSIKDTRGVAVSKDGSFTGVAYTTLPAAWAATGVDTSKPGFVAKIYQVDPLDVGGVAHATDNANNGVSVASGERMMHGDLGANTADLSLFTGTGGTYTETKAINYNAFTGDIGFYKDDGTVAGLPASPNVPGLPGSALRESGFDDVTMTFITYIEFPKSGEYQLIFNSDDGFRMTASANPAEILNAPIVAQFDNGRGAADTVGWVYVPTPGIYGFRSIWLEGGGGANLEWAAVNADGVRALVNDTTTTGALKAYAVNNGAMPAAVTYADPPRGSGRQVSAGYPVTFEITDGATAVSGITLTINGTAVTPTVTKSGKVSKVVYSGLLPRNQTVTAVIGFTDGTTNYSGSNSFSVGGGADVPPSMALKAADVNKSNPGFLIKTWQTAILNDGATGENSPGNSTEIGEAWVNNLWGWPNTANLAAFTGPGGSYVETGFINYNGATDQQGSFTTANDGFTDIAMPGVPGSATLEGGLDNYALEIRTVLDLQPGSYYFGVNSDDGFRVIVGDGKEAYSLPVVCGEFSGGRGADNWNFTQFSVKITQAGLYPFRLVFEEGGGGNNVEWFQITRPWQPDQIGKLLVNDTATSASAIKAYQYPINSTGPTYVKSIAPGRSSLDSAASTGRAGPDATVKLVLVDGSTPVDTASVSMTINGAPVTPTATKVGTETTVSYKPAAGFTMGNSYDVAVTFGDRTVNWTFKVGLPATPTFWIEAADYDYNGGQTKPEASVMPYAGGAYAGLAGVSGTDFNGPNDADNPYYRYPNTQRVPMSFANDRDRGAGEVVVNYRIGWGGNGQWYNYTRTFPSGKMNVYASMSQGGAGDVQGGMLEDWTSGTPTILGVFNQKATASWGNQDLIPMKDAATTNTVVSVDLTGTRKLRFTLSPSGDWGGLLFAPEAATQPQFTGVTKNTDGSVTVSWTGGGTLQVTSDLGTTPIQWQDVTGQTSPYTFTPQANQPHLFGRIKQ